ncbi:MAG: hypothetical protein B9S33_11125 [Pedosphaera sp. Tous-C6FEB]|nr:MAG: hypothetical protein B9S33_11125 [Pedosphaera sp. Tous-C6FEB]
MLVTSLFPIRVHSRVSRALLLLFALALVAHAGSLRTREGKFLEGNVQLDAPAGVKVTLANGQQQAFPFASLEQVVFTASSPTSLPPEVAALMKGQGLGLLGTYYERVDLSGRAVHRLDETINFDWELGEPIAGVQKDYFSARWAGQLEAPVSGKFTFHLDADDGARLWVGDRLICDAWRISDSSEISGTMDLQAGQRYDFRIEYYDNLGPAHLRLTWSAPGIPKSLIPRSQLHPILAVKPTDNKGLLAAYFRRTELDSISAVTRLDPQLDFTWGNNAPVAEVPAESFSVRWSGQVTAPFTESHTFHVEAGGGVRVWLDGQRILDQWRDQPGEFYSTVVPLTAGQKYDLRVEHSSTNKEAKLRLLWSSASQRKSVIPATALSPSQPARPAGAKPVHGLLGTYFSRADCSSEVLKRVDAQVNFDWADKPAALGVPTEDFSVRWTGQVQVQHTENHTFHLETDDGVRVWVGDKQVIDEWRQQATTVVSLPVPLTAGQFYPLTIEYFSAKPPALVKLKWSSPSTPLGIIPANRLYPPHAPSTPAPGERRLGLDRGVVTWDGSFLAAPPVAGDDTALQFGGAQKDFSLSTVNAARLIFQNVSAQRAAKVEPGRSGVLLVNGDFVDGEFKGLDRGRVKLSSVLFGLKFFDANYEVVAVILREPAPGTPQFLIRASDGSVLLVKKFAITPEGLTIEDATLRGYKVPAQELVEVRQGSGTNLFSASLRLGPQSLHAQMARADAAAEREWKAKAEAVRNVVLAENDKRARMDDEEQRKIRTELDAVTEAERTLKSATAKLTANQEALAKARVELKDAEAKAEELRLAAKKAVEVHDARIVETEKHSAQHDKGKAAYSQRGQELLVATRTRDVRQSTLNNEVSAAESAVSSARNRLAAAKQDELNRMKSAEANRKAAALVAEQGEAARVKIEAAWKAMQADAVKAVAARDEAKKLMDKVAAESASAVKKAADSKLAADKATTESAAKAKAVTDARAHADKLAAKAAAEKTAAEAAATLAKTAADKAATELASSLKAAADLKQAADQATSDSAAKAKTAAAARVTADKLAATAVTEKAAAEAAANLAKAAADKAATDLASAMKKAADSKLVADKASTESAARAKAATDARAAADKLTAKAATEKAAAEAAANLAKTAADKAASDLTSSLKAAADHKLAADQAASDSAAKAKTAAAARASADKVAATAVTEKAAAEAAATLAKTAADKAATDLASAMKKAADSKLVADKATTESAARAKAATDARASADKLAAQAATEKAAAEAAWNLAKTAADKAATELTNSLKVANDNKLAAEKATTESAAKAKAVTDARANADKLAAKAATEKAAAEAAATLAKTAADKAATDLASAMKKAADSKLAADKATTESAARAKAATDARASADKLAAQAATEKAAAEAAWNLAKTAADKAAAELASALKASADNKLAADKLNTELAAATRTAEAARVKRDALQADEAAKKRDLDRLAAESTVKAAAAKTAQAAFEKTEREVKEARGKAEAMLQQAEAKLAELKAGREKELALLNAKVTELEAARKALDKANSELWNHILKLAQERDALKLQRTNAESALGRASTELSLRQRGVQSAETLVTQATEMKLAGEKLLTVAKAAVDKRARAQFK